MGDVEQSGGSSRSADPTLAGAVFTEALLTHSSPGGSHGEVWSRSLAMQWGNAFFINDMTYFMTVISLFTLVDVEPAHVLFRFATSSDLLRVKA